MTGIKTATAPSAVEQLGTPLPDAMITIQALGLGPRYLNL